MVVRRVFLGLDPAIDDELCLRAIQRALTSSSSGPWLRLPDIYVQMLDAETSRAIGRRWISVGTAGYAERLESYELTTAWIGRLCSAPTCAIMIDELRRMTAFAAWMDVHESYWLASCGSLLSGDVDLVDVEFPQRKTSFEELSAIEVLPRSRRAREAQAQLDRASDAATIGLRQWLPHCAWKPFSYRQILEAPIAHRLSADGRWLERARETIDPGTLVDLHALRPEYREVAVPWDPGSWELATAV